MSVPSRDGNGAVSFPVIPRTCTRPVRRGADSSRRSSFAAERRQEFRYGTQECVRPPTASLPPQSPPIPYPLPTTYLAPLTRGTAANARAPLPAAGLPPPPPPPEPPPPAAPPLPPAGSTAAPRSKAVTALPQDRK